MQRILLIDDESVMTDGIRDGLEDLRSEGKIGEYMVFTAIDFYKARDYLDKHSFDLIVTDLLMPPLGLDEVPRHDRKRGAALNGWVFLNHFILKPNSPYYSAHTHTKMIVFSAYLDRLKKYFSETEFNMELYRERLSFVNKGNIFDESGGLNKLMEEIKEILP